MDAPKRYVVTVFYMKLTSILTVETTDAAAITATQQSSSASTIVTKAFNDVICSRDQ